MTSNSRLSGLISEAELLCGSVNDGESGAKVGFEAHEVSAKPQHADCNQIEKFLREQFLQLRKDIRRDLLDLLGPRDQRVNPSITMNSGEGEKYARQKTSGLGSLGRSSFAKLATPGSALKTPTPAQQRTAGHERDAIAAVKQIAQKTIASKFAGKTPRKDASQRTVHLDPTSIPAEPVGVFPSESSNGMHNLASTDMNRWLEACDSKAVRSEMVGHWTRCQDNLAIADRPTGPLVEIVESLAFDLFSSALIFINAFTIGLHTDAMARAQSRTTSETYTHLDHVFCGLFTLELILRAGAYGRRFFTLSGWRWSVFDCLLVGLQLSEIVLTQFARGANEDQANISFMRALRILRLIRVLRVVRIVRLISELRTIVISIMNAMHSLFWTMVLLLLMIYVQSLYFTQLVVDYRVTVGEIDADPRLTEHFGGVGKSMLSLFEAISGGVDWDNLCSPLVASISVIHGLIFCGYIAFAVLALMNVVTGVFVEGALKSARKEDERCLTENLRNVFCDLPSSEITKIEFMQRVENPVLQDLFNSMHIDAGEAHALFYALDMDNAGIIHIEEFIYGCLRLRGSAKTIDIFTLMKDMQTLHTNVHYIAKQIGC